MQETRTQKCISTKNRLFVLVLIQSKIYICILHKHKKKNIDRGLYSERLENKCIDQ